MDQCGTPRNPEFIMRSIYTIPLVACSLWLGWLPPAEPRSPAQMSPAEAAEVPNGCDTTAATNPDRPWESSGLEWRFAWEAIPNARQYHLKVWGPAAARALVDDSALTSNSYVETGGTISERKLKGWRWKVRVKVGNAWSAWSPERLFDVASCKR